MTPPDRDLRRRSSPDLVCLSHLRWNWVFQRPQHLMTRAARDRRVFFVEEPVIAPGPARLTVWSPQANLWVATPQVPEGVAGDALDAVQGDLISELLSSFEIEEYVLWYYTPMAWPFTKHLSPLSVVYDCMDELSAFAGAPPRLQAMERELMAECDLVLTGGHTLYEAKRALHPNVHAFPSSVDVTHFARARTHLGEPADQAPIPRPRLGYFGVLDERLDLELLAGVAAERPDWHLVLVGPVTKIDPTALPKAPNIHLLGPKSYDELPAYASGWDVGLLPFAHNDATRHLSPTKTPEYLAAGLPVVSTSIRDVIRTYGAAGFVRIADTVSDFVAAVEQSLADRDPARLERVDRFLGEQSWDSTWNLMNTLINRACAQAA